MEHQDQADEKQQKRMEGLGELDVVDDAEWTKVAELRAILESEDPASKGVDNLVLRRFLRARDLDIEKASVMFLKYMKWKREAVPNGSITSREVENELVKDKIFMQGSDKTGQLIVVLFAAKHYTAQRDLDEFKRFVVYCLDKICARMPHGREKFVAIADLKGWGYSNCDIRGYLAALDILQSYYPERLGKAILIHVPYLFMTAWKIVCPFIDDKTKKKFVFVDDKKLDATLRADIDESQLPTIYGGKLPLTRMEN